MDLPKDDRGRVTESGCEQELECKDREGYVRKPVKKGEFDAWESEQAWGDDY